MSLLNFSLLDQFISDRGALKSLTIIVNFAISPCSSIIFFVLAYFDALLFGAYIWIFSLAHSHNLYLLFGVLDH